MPKHNHDEQVKNPQSFNQNDLIKDNYEYNTELPIVNRENTSGTNGGAAKFDNALDKAVQPRATAN